MHLALTRCNVRSWRRSDVEPLAAHANNRNIWINLRDRFPHPYTKADARAFIRWAREQRPETAFAIAVGDEAVGGIGFVMHADVVRGLVEIGYVLGGTVW